MTLPIERSLSWRIVGYSETLGMAAVDAKSPLALKIAESPACCRVVGEPDFVPKMEFA
jgi:hypothetical protein